MPGPRYSPRGFSDEPSAFGRATHIAWRKSSSNEESLRRRAAQLQHRYSLRIRKRLKEKSLNVKKYAAMAGVKYDRMARVLRGEIVMRLEDIALADLVLGEVSEEAQEAAERQRQRDAKAQSDAGVTAAVKKPMTLREQVEADTRTVKQQRGQRRQPPDRRL